jgi:phosphopantetheine--protein transferase-like protein
MEETIKSILVGFLKTDSQTITSSTIIDKSAIKSSIMVHRFYGELANAGVAVDNYLSIRTYGELLNRISKTEEHIQSREFPVHNDGGGVDKGQVMGVGIDIESNVRMPHCLDFRVDSFYQQNFSPREISYCTLQRHVIGSFAGLFAMKEAIVKANNAYKNVPFNQIEIEHDVQGKPIKEGFQLSISHMAELSIAVAVCATGEPNQDMQVKFLESQNMLFKNQLRINLMIALVSLLSSIIAILFLMFK